MHAGYNNTLYTLSMTRNYRRSFITGAPKSAEIFFYYSAVKVTDAAEHHSVLHHRGDVHGLELAGALQTLGAWRACRACTWETSCMRASGRTYACSLISTCKPR